MAGVSQVATLGPWSGSLASAAGSTDSLLYLVTAYTTSGAAISTSAPLYNGSTPLGTVKVFERQSASANGVYNAAWLLPNVGSAGTSVSITVTGANTPGDNHTVGLTVFDLTGLGASPVAEVAGTGAGTGTALTVSTSGNTTAAPGVVIASLISFGSVVTAVGAPWTESWLSDQFAIAGYQVHAAAGSGFTYGSTAGLANDWVAGVIVIEATQSAPPAAPVTSRRPRLPVPPQRRYRQQLPVPAQLNPPYPVTVIAQHRETWARGAPRRARITLVVQPQLNPPYPVAEEAQRRQAWPRALARRGRQAVPVPAQEQPVAEAVQQRRPRGLPSRRGRGFTPVPAQQAAAPNPSITFQQPRHLRALYWRRGRTVMPVPAQQAAPASPAITFQQPRHQRVVFQRRGRGVTPVPAQQPAPPAWTWQPPRHPRPALAPRRGRGPVHVPGQQDQAPRQRLSPRRGIVPQRRARATLPLPAAAAPALVSPHRLPLRALAMARRRLAQLLPWPQAARPTFSVGSLASSTSSGGMNAGSTSTYAPPGETTTRP